VSQNVNEDSGQHRIFNRFASALGIPNATCLNRGRFSSGAKQQFNWEISSAAPMA
jgi:hypothetical protein